MRAFDLWTILYRSKFHAPSSAGGRLRERGVSWSSEAAGRFPAFLHFLQANRPARSCKHVGAGRRGAEIILRGEPLDRHVPHNRVRRTEQLNVAALHALDAGPFRKGRIRRSLRTNKQKFQRDALEDDEHLRLAQHAQEYLLARHVGIFAAQTRAASTELADWPTGGFAAINLMEGVRGATSAHDAVV
jgi:hypothetical protein